MHSVDEPFLGIGFPTSMNLWTPVDPGGSWFELSSPKREAKRWLDPKALKWCLAQFQVAGVLMLRQVTGSPSILSVLFKGRPTLKEIGVSRVLTS